MKHRLIYLCIAFLFSILFVSSSFYLPISFSATHDLTMSQIALWLTQSGGTIGVPIITLLCCLCIAQRFKGWRNKILQSSLLLMLFAITLGGFAKLNERIIKENIKVNRPNINYLSKAYGFDSQAYYHFKHKEDRRDYIKSFLQTQPKIVIHQKTINQNVIDHWIYEAGYSFPSGHSGNAFLMAALLGYILLLIHNNTLGWFLFTLLYIWATFVALSRVALGVHSPTDITLGAIMGTCLAFIIILLGAIDKLAAPKN